MKLWRADSRAAQNQWEEVSKQIQDKEDEINNLKALRKCLGDYLCLLEGGCDLCQNNHWPHCEDNQKG